MDAIQQLRDRLINEMATRMQTKDITVILDVLNDAEEEIERLKTIIEQNALPLHPCAECGKEERNPGLSVCGECYHKQITGEW